MQNGRMVGRTQVSTPTPIHIQQLHNTHLGPQGLEMSIQRLLEREKLLTSQVQGRILDQLPTSGSVLISILNTHAVISTGGGQKVVSVDNLIDTLSLPVDFETPLLPNNCIYYFSQGKTTILLLEYHPSIIDFKYISRTWVEQERDYDDDNEDDEDDEGYYHDSEEEIKSIYTPRTIAAVVLGREGKSYFIRNYKLFAVKKEVCINNSTELYMYPGCNIYGDSNVCWGSVEAPYNSLGLLSISNIYDLYLEGVNNYDLNLNIEGIYNYEEFIDLLYRYSGVPERYYSPTRRYSFGTVRPDDPKKDSPADIEFLLKSLIKKFVV